MVGKLIIGGIAMASAIMANAAELTAKENAIVSKAKEHVQNANRPN